MSSLVAYEDSESEGDSLDQKQGECSTSVQTDSCEQAKDNQEVSASHFFEVMQSPQIFTADPDRTMLESQLPQSCFDRGMKYCKSGTTQDKHFKESAAPLSLPGTQGKHPPLQTFPHMAQSVGDGSKTAKRPHTVRPYIPKRQRLFTSLEKADTKCVAEQAPETQTRESQILSDVSPKVKPYLPHKPGTAGIPRRLLMSLGGHQGPVNTVQWCPVPHLSHLLLSASMDKTFKVMTAAMNTVQQSEFRN